MLYNRTDSELTVERQFGEARDLLQRLVRELQSKFGVGCFRVADSGRNHHNRRYIVLGFRDDIAAAAAERWIKDQFEVG